MINLALAAILLFVQPAHSAGETVSLTASGLVHVKTVAEKIGNALSAAMTVLGFGYVPSNGGGRFIVPFHAPYYPSFVDTAVIPIAPVAPAAEILSGTAATDIFGFAGGQPPTPSFYSSYSRHTFHNPGSCGDDEAFTHGGAANCNGVVTSATEDTVYVNLPGLPWYHPKCSCDGSCLKDSPGCPYTTASPCTPIGTGNDVESITIYIVCADPHETATSTPWPNQFGPRPAGEFQPEFHAAADVAATETAKTNIAAALDWFDANVPEPMYNNPASALGKTYKAISDGSIALNTPTILPVDGFTFPVGSPALSGGSCSSCTVVSPSTSATQNVWIKNGQLHVWIDNPPAAAASSSVTVNVSISTSISLANGDAVSLSTFAVVADTLTFAGVYANFIATRSSSALLGMISNYQIVFASAPPFNTNLCLPMGSWGNHCVDINENGQFDLLIQILHWGVITSALISAYGIIYS